MKQCPRCQRAYQDDQLNFCLDDGEMLTLTTRTQTRYADDAPPTLLLDQSRVTNPSEWPNSPQPQPPMPWQGQPQNVPQPQFAPLVMNRSADQTLAVVSLILGIASITIGWCCSSGMLLSPAALITGFLALFFIKKDPGAYTGRGLAIGGIIMGAIFLAAYVFVVLIYGIAIIGGGLGGLN